TSVVVATATASWIIPDRQVSAAASSSVFRSTGRPTVRRGSALPLMRAAPEPGAKRRRPAVRRMADGRTAEHGLREASDRDRPPPAEELAQEGQAALDLVAGRRPVRRRRPGVGGDDVPEQHVLLAPE